MSKQILLLCLLFTGCGFLTPPEAQIRVLEVDRKEPIGRQGRYEKCLLKLNERGIRQDLLKTLCDSAHGRLEK